MLFNSFGTNIFEECYAYKRVKNFCIANDIPDIDCIVDYPFDPTTNFNEGQFCDEETGFWYNYPENIAIIYEVDQQFALQTYSNHIVGKFYTHIEDNENEIREFLTQNEGNVILLENSMSARTIKPDYESLMLYIEKKKALNLHRNEYRKLYRECKKLSIRLKQYRIYADKYTPEENYSAVTYFTEEFLNEAVKLPKLFTEMEKEKMNEVAVPISEKEGYSIIFALFYRYHLDEKKNKYHSTELKTKFRDFITRHPEAAEYFCEGPGKAHFTKDEVKEELEKGILSFSAYDIIADEIFA